MDRRLRVVDLFAGCGGLTSGLVATGGFVSVGGVEMDPHAAATYAANFGDHLYVGDIADWLVGSLPLAEVVVGGPPCQGFSALGKNDPLDPRNVLWELYVDALLRIRPAVFILENVPQFLSSAQFVRLQDELQPGGRLAAWEIEPFVLNANDYGVSQARRRAVVIGRLATMAPFGKPEPVYPGRTVMDALAHVEPRVTQIELPESCVPFGASTVPGRFKTPELHVTRLPTELSRKRYAAIPAGGNRHNLPDELLTPCWRGHRTGSGDVMGRLSWDRPSVTIRTEFFKPEKGRYLHPDQDRPITHYEAALIQGFPENFEWCGTKTSIARQIGNAVPPPLAQALGQLILTRISR